MDSPTIDTSETSIFDLLDGAWSKGLEEASKLESRSPSPASFTTYTGSEYTPIASASPRTTFQDSLPDPFTKYPAAKTEGLRTVHRISPLESFNAGRVLGFAKPAHGSDVAHPQPPAASKPVPFAASLLGPAAAPPRAPAGGPDTSNPVPIPGALQDSLQRSRSLIKAVPAPTTAPIPIKREMFHGRGAATPLPPPQGSWTERQARFQLGRPSQQPQGLTKALQARDAAVRARRAAAGHSAKTAAPPEEVAWRIRFKRKWIREEIFARKMEFPDDPSYDDEWEDAQRFLEACGPNGALQAAFLQTAASNHSESDDDELMASAESILFQEEPQDDAKSLGGSTGSACFNLGAATRRSNSSQSEVVAKAAALVRLHKKKAAAA